ncbi:helix-turn-helix transcriptional regulator [Clostridium sp. NSJ-6]|uniref:Helix-turn-helix transcriptional regulator n=1 Tax=Clostridium hominis TaxID=2763036 RepID=A0ABR7DGS5_9CLOT|nr:helix-turn-helix transcriptional regulator [Clostridium hominis]MBC5630632.1 helix-turn-helix transcriptional regulator [Clostridium hominis]
MDITKIIKKLLIDKGMTQTELAKKLNTSSGNLTNKLRRNDFRISELEEISEAIGYELKIEFIEK